MKHFRSRDSCAVVIPCSNEADRLNVDAFAEFVIDTDDVELIFVDDGSSDETLQSAQRALVGKDLRQTGSCSAGNVVGRRTRPHQHSRNTEH
jgi:glycosyltransferase involved in cell wall biosynthesis